VAGYVNTIVKIQAATMQTKSWLAEGQLAFEG
jgi:hypothetical protein